MAAKQGKFAGRAKSILGQGGSKPQSIEDLLGNGDTENQETVKPVSRKVDERNDSKTSPMEWVREEFRLPADLAEQLRLYAFENRTKKVAVVRQALEEFFGRQDRR